LTLESFDTRISALEKTIEKLKKALDCYKECTLGVGVDAWVKEGIIKALQALRTDKE
jgi:hypothetical protein